MSKNFVKSLPGPKSYCKCAKLCSPAEIDHVLPQSLIKETISDKKLLKRALNDAHNRYTCCRMLNQKKSNKILGVNWFAKSHNSHLARSALYMKDKYNLKLPDELSSIWINMSMDLEPWDFEQERNSMILEKQGNVNLYVDNYPKKLTLLDNKEFD